METRIASVALCLAATVVAPGCRIDVGGVDAGVEAASGFGCAWTVADPKGSELTCDAAGAAYARVTVDDSAGKIHVVHFECAPMKGTASGLEVATGPAKVTFQLLTRQDAILVETSFDHELVTGALGNDLGRLDLTVAPWAPSRGAKGTIEWRWTVAGEEPTADNGLCAAAGVDDVELWVWNEEIGEWWRNEERTRFPCEAVDHGDGLAPWAGLRAEKLLAPGAYRLFLGFYRETIFGKNGDATGVLLYADTRDNVVVGSGEDLFDPTDLDPAAVGRGVLKINLSWRKASGSAYAACKGSSVARMGFLLRAGDLVAADVPLAKDGPGCLDAIVLEDVPVPANGYELLVSGLAKDGALPWHGLCRSLVPEEGVTAGEATGDDCEIANDLERP
ncbi:MAG: hypothetical protein PHU25_02165 [Deltaproteobacteria bacterium]|nr:hypothetical protein [Deltaproteobacteria bacterium]